jgi:hypothetical protein
MSFQSAIANYATANIDPPPAVKLAGSMPIVREITDPDQILIERLRDVLFVRSRFVLLKSGPAIVESA